VASGAGLAGSYVLDLPTGAAMVAAFALLLLLAGLARALLLDAERRRANWGIAARGAALLVLMLTFASSLWLILNPAADQPLAALVEAATGIGPAQYLAAREREIYAAAVEDMGRFQAEVDRLNAGERAARYQGAPLSDDEIRRIASYQQSFSEMTRGERFVQDVLRAKARSRERWIFGLPLALAALLGLGWLGRPVWRPLVSKR
jgi:zinc/manganese transport system permease protein